ncbi:MAG: hypothetical protein AAF587_23000 [Bacteroidota bacterium]
MLRSLITASLGLLPLIAYAQFKVVEYDYANAYFNNGQDLPAGSKLILTGKMPVQADWIEAELYKTNGSKKLLFSSTWKRETGDNGLNFRMPFHYELHSNTRYDFRFFFYKFLQTDQKAELTSDLHQSLDTYIDQSFAPKGSRMKKLRNQHKVISDLNAIVEDGLTYTRHSRDDSFSGFSDLVKDGFAQIERYTADQKNVSDLGFKQDKDAVPGSSSSAEIFRAKIQELKDIIHMELDTYLKQPQLMQIELKEVIGYETDKASGALALNVGYGGVLLGGKSLDQLTYGTSPFVGISLPLANRTYGPAILANTSLSIGVFTRNFLSADSSEVSGPVFGRPYFMGVGYNLFRFIKINAGATALETRGSSSITEGSASLDPKAISIRPFIGISAEIDLWMGLRERR